MSRNSFHVVAGIRQVRIFTNEKQRKIRSPAPCVVWLFEGNQTSNILVGLWSELNAYPHLVVVVVVFPPHKISIPKVLSALRWPNKAVRRVFGPKILEELKGRPWKFVPRNVECHHTHTDRQSESRATGNKTAARTGEKVRVASLCC